MAKKIKINENGEVEIQHFDGGGVVGGGGLLGGVGGAASGLAGDFTTQNSYQATQAPTDYTNFGNTINTSTGNSFAGYGNAQGIQAQQQALADTLLRQSQGQGPNPAQAQLNESTGKNIAGQSALMAGQRGGASNVGLLARQAGQQGAATQQQAVGQGAALQAQQQLAAQQALQQQQATMGTQNIAEQGVNNQLFNTAAGAQNTQNSNNIQNTAMAQNINSQTSQNNANSVNQKEGGLLSSIPVVGSLFGAEGGLVTHHGFEHKSAPKMSNVSMKDRYPGHIQNMADLYHGEAMAEGGEVGESASVFTPNLSNAAMYAGGGSKKSKPDSPAPDALKTDPISDLAGGAGDAGGITGAAPASEIGDISGLAMLAAAGGKVPGKPKYPGNNYKNDTVPTMLSPGELVINNEIMQSSDPVKNAAKFVAAHLEDKKSKNPDKDFKEALGRAIQGRKK